MPADLTPGEVGQRLVTVVDHLFPAVDIKLPEDKIEMYAAQHARHPYGFGNDRQSIAKVLSEKKRTGQEGRINNICDAARNHTLWLPHPVEREDRQEGELQYIFDRDYWFVDGECENATGEAASPYARPELWRGWKLACALSEKGIGPRAFIIGSPERFFRHGAWWTVWFESLKNHGVDTIVAGWGVVDDQNLPMILAYVTYLSKWLPERLKNAREARYRRKEIAHNRPPFGLTFLDRQTVAPHALEWPIIQECIAQIACGVLNNATEAAAWVDAACRERGIDSRRRATSRCTVLQWLRGPLLDGWYVDGKTQNIPRLLKDARSPMTDLDLTPQGNRRYLRLRLSGHPFPIRLADDQQIPVQELSRCS
jgi:hypothetical protein